MKKYTEEQINKELATLKNWEYNENSIHASFEFGDFKETFNIMTQIAFEAEAQQHHPEWMNVYNKLFISLSSHDAGGVTQKDFDLAKAIETIVKTD